MRILWIHQYFATPSGWGSQRMYEFGRRFVAAGHAVDVLCCAAYDPTLAGRRLVEIDGLRVHVSRTRYRQRMGIVARLGAFAAVMLFGLWHVLRHGRRYDLVVASSGPLTTAVPALLAKWCYGRPFVFEVLDVWPDAAIDARVLRNGWLKWLAFRLEACAYRQATHIVTCSEGMTARLLRKGVPPDRISTIPHGCDRDLFAPDARKRAATRAALGVRDNQTVVLYAGAMGRGNAIDDVVKTVALTADDPRIVWWFAGDGAEAEKVRKLADGGRTDGGGTADRCRNEPEHACVRFFGAVSRARIVELHQGADVVLVTFMHAPLFHENSPNKFFDAIAASLPVIFNRSTWLEPWLERYGNAIVCRDEPPAPAMSGALQHLAGDPSARTRMGAASRRLACEVFDRDRLALDFLRIVEEAGKGRARVGRSGGGRSDRLTVRPVGARMVGLDQNPRKGYLEETKRRHL